MYSTSDFRKGLRIEWEGKPYEIVDFLHVKPGKGGAFVRTKLRNMLTGGVVDQNFRSGERVGRPDLQEREMQFLYKDEENNYHMMDNETYEQPFLTAGQLAETREFFHDGIVVKVLYYKDQPIGVDLPTFVALTVADTEPGLRGDTASGGSKPAVLESGASIQVPLFINVGDKVKVDTRSHTYIERVK
ncbi:MAG: elongation factor P [Deltaproteobacteria bacterium]|nr:elongation factor P [Deltaproteobacteria bacterium]